MQLQYIGGEGKYAALGVYNSHSNLPDRCFWGTAHLARRKRVTGLEIMFFLPRIFIKGAGLQTVGRRNCSGECCPPTWMEAQEKMAVLAQKGPRQNFWFCMKQLPHYQRWPVNQTGSREHQDLPLSLRSSHFLRPPPGWATISLILKLVTCIPHQPASNFFLREKKKYKKKKKKIQLN